MKEIIVCITILLLIVVKSNAQNLKIELGLGNTWQLDRNDENINIDCKFMLNYSIGLSNEFRIEDKSILKTGLYFEQNGRKEILTYYSNGTPDNFDRKTKIWYLNLPITYKYNFNIKEVFFFVEAGIYGGYALFGTDKYQLIENGKVVEVSEKLTFRGTNNSGLNPFDFGLISAFGIKIAGIDTYIKYKHGILDINKQSQRTMKNRSLMLMLGIPI